VCVEFEGKGVAEGTHLGKGAALYIPGGVLDLRVQI
jgi:hypothetical protein